MAANVGEEYAHLASAHGAEMAGKIVSFTFRNLQKMQELIKEYDAEELSEMQRLKKLRAFLTEDTFEDFKRSLAKLESDNPSWKGLYTILGKESLIKVCSFSLDVASKLTSKGIWNSWRSRRSFAPGRNCLAIPTCYKDLCGPFEEIP